MSRWFRSVILSSVFVVAVAGVALAALPPGGTFVDDDGNLHEGNIEAVAAEGITKGCNPPTEDFYCPSDVVTRGQMAAFLVRALGLTEAGPVFDDTVGNIFEQDISRLAQAGITKGCNPPDNTNYCPDDPVTRGQMAAFLVRAFHYTDDGGGNLFVDDDGSVFEGDIDRLGTAGVTKGCNPPDNDRFCPNDPVLRDQMASFLARALGLAAMVPPPRANAAVAWIQHWYNEQFSLTDPPSGVTGPLQLECGDTGPVAAGDVFACLGRPQTEPDFMLDPVGIVVYVLDPSGVAAWSAGTDVPDTTSELLSIYSNEVPHGLSCSDLLSQSFPLFSGAGRPEDSAFFWSLVYWSLEGMPSRMDADGNGVPCETLYAPDVVAAVLQGGPTY